MRYRGKRHADSGVVYQAAVEPRANRVSTDARRAWLRGSRSGTRVILHPSLPRSATGRHRQALSSSPRCSEDTVQSVEVGVDEEKANLSMNGIRRWRWRVIDPRQTAHLGLSWRANCKRSFAASSTVTMPAKARAAAKPQVEDLQGNFRFIGAVPAHSLQICPNRSHFLQTLVVGAIISSLKDSVLRHFGSQPYGSGLQRVLSWTQETRGYVISPPQSFVHPVTHGWG